MFYSHTFLARKGPLGTVWLAAHLQHKLKKSHYTSTHIPSTVERIMCPEVPIALRMSGHLLLGVVRIYSKKVDYLHQDCNSLWVSWRNAFRPVDVNLQENASQAQFQAVTLPETYQLDAFDIDLTMSLDDSAPDNHLRSREEITLTDRYPSAGELYVRITVDDDISPDMSRSEASPHGEVDPMQIDNPPQEPLTGSRADQDGDSGPNRQSEDRHGRFGEGSSIPDIAYEYEILRDYRGDHNQNVLIEELTLHGQNTSPQRDTPQNEADTPLLESILAHAVVSSPSSQRAGPPSPSNDISPGMFDSFVNIPPLELRLRSTPRPEKSSDVGVDIAPPELTRRSTSPPEKDLSPHRQTLPPEQPQQRRRKKRQFFDESLVLTNRFLKNALNDPSDLVKRRKKLPCSALEMWRFRNNRKKEHIFSETLISGFCNELQIVSNKDMISAKAHSVLSENIQPEATVAESPARITNDAMELERLRSPDHDAGHNFTHEFRPSSPQITPQHSQQNVQTSSSPGILDSVSELQFETTTGTVSEPQSGRAFDSESDHGMFTGSAGLGLKTPVSNFEERIGGSNAALSGIPELRGSAELDDLSFLEQDNTTPPDSQGPHKSDLMSVRTKAMEQYLINHSPLSKSSSSPSEELSLNSILEGRSRKLCARMFYEILQLKTREVIDVKQDEPYGNIMLKLTRKRSKISRP